MESEELDNQKEDARAESNKEAVDSLGRWNTSERVQQWPS